MAGLARKIHACRQCPLSRGRTNAVPGEGNPRAEILFVGEAPGRQEDLEGRPFCGPAGHLLDELLASIGLKRSDVYIANVVKCRPPGNRDPKPEEIDACFPYLARQIEIIRPKIIVCLGRHSLKRFLPGLGSISELHGRAFFPKPNVNHSRSNKNNVFALRYRPKAIMALYHPAVGLYQQSMRKILFADFKKLKLLLEKIKK